MKKTISIITMVLLAFIFVSCDDETPTFEYQYSDYSYYKIKTFDQQLNYQEGTYYIYYYSEGCPSCQSIKEDVLSIIAYLDEDSLLLFDVYSSPQIALEPSFNVSQTPSLVRVTNHQFNGLYVGVEDILPILGGLK